MAQSRVTFTTKIKRLTDKRTVNGDKYLKVLMSETEIKIFNSHLLAIV